MLQSAHIQPGEYGGRLMIAQMTEAAAYTPLEAVWIIAVHQHVAIVVTFQNQAMTTAQHLLDMRRAAPGIGQNAQPPRSIAEHELHRLGGIVRYGIGEDFNITNCERLVRINFAGLNRAGKSRQLAAQRAVGKPNRQIEFARQARYPADMIAMLMRDNHTAQLFGGYTQTRQTRNSVFQTETAVQQHLRLTGRNQQRVSLAAAAQ